MKKLIQIAVLQVILGLVFIGGAKGAAGCGQIFRSSESYSSQCNCEGSPMDLYEYSRPGTWRCCGWVVGEGSEKVCRAYHPGEYTCGDSIPDTDSLADVTCSCEGATWTEYTEGILWNFNRKYCCGWV